MINLGKPGDDRRNEGPIKKREGVKIAHKINGQEGSEENNKQDQIF